MAGSVLSGLLEKNPKVGGPMQSRRALGLFYAG